jgi:hypothetical protein
MTLAKHAQSCVRSIAVTCDLCHHAAQLDVDAYAGDVPVPSFGPRMVCTCCGIIGAEARPNWRERRAQGRGMRLTTDQRRALRRRGGATGSRASCWPGWSAMGLASMV